MRGWARFNSKNSFRLLLLAACISPVFFLARITQATKAAACPPEGCKLFIPAALKLIDQVANGDFEMGAKVWKEYSALNYFIILPSYGDLPIPPHSGLWAAWLGGIDGETASIDQDIYVSTAHPYLHYWVWIISDETNCSNDLARVLINTTALNQTNLCQQTNTTAWEQRSLDLTAYAGKLVNLKFWVNTDALSGISSLYLDDISLQAVP